MPSLMGHVTFCQTWPSAGFNRPLMFGWEPWTFDSEHLTFGCWPSMFGCLYSIHYILLELGCNCPPGTICSTKTVIKSEKNTSTYETSNAGNPAKCDPNWTRIEPTMLDFCSGEKWTLPAPWDWWVILFGNTPPPLLVMIVASILVQFRSYLAGLPASDVS